MIERFKETDFAKLFEDEEQNYKWKPFPDHYVSKKAQVDLFIPQISMKFPYVHVIAKLTDNFEMFQEFGADENVTPLKVLCWNDISSLTARMAAKTVEAGLDRLYASIHEGITFECHSVLSNIGHEIEFPNGNPDIFVFHVLDPTIPQARKYRTSHSTMIPSFETKQISSLANGKNGPKNLEIPIQSNMTSLENLSRKYSKQSTIFIFDCSFAKKSMDGILFNEESKKNPFIIFAATSHLLNYSSHLPCDLFTSCLLTPAKVALLWQSHKVGHFKSGILKEIELQTLIDQLNDSYESNNILKILNSALSAIADKIAIDLYLPTDKQKLFFQIFRRDSFTSQLFYNYMFSTRIMTALAMDPSSYPRIIDSTQHPLWDTFDLQVDRALFSLVNSFSPIHIPKTLFSFDDLLTEAMEKLQSWLRFPISRRKMPNEICYLPMLLLSETHFKPAIIFCSNFIQISEKTARIFLYTRSFPVLPQCLERIEKNFKSFDYGTIAAFSFVVADSVLLVPKLAEYFKPKTSFWFQFIPRLIDEDDAKYSSNNSIGPQASSSFFTDNNIISSSLTNESDSESDIGNDDNVGSLIDIRCLSQSDSNDNHALQLVVISSLSVLLIFLDGEEQIKYYLESNIVDLLSDISQSNCLPRIRCLANLILSQLGVEFDIQKENKIYNESNPLCRAAILSRFQVTIHYLNEQIQKQDPKNKADFYWVQMALDNLLKEVILAMNDLYPLVRENALVVFSHALDFANSISKKKHPKKKKKNKKDDDDDESENSNNNNNNNNNDNDDDDYDYEEEDNNDEIKKRNKQFLEAIDQCLQGALEPESAPLIPNLFVKHFRSFLYETSVRVDEMLIQFCLFLKLKLDHEKADPLVSNLKFSCLNKLSHLQSKDQMPKSFFQKETLIATPTMATSSSYQQLHVATPQPKKFKLQQQFCKKAVQEDILPMNKKTPYIFIGKPAISPSGLLASSRIDGSISYQYYSSDNSTNPQIISKVHNWFLMRNNICDIDHFRNLSNYRKKFSPQVSYLQFVNDSKLLAGSSCSQVVVIDLNMIEEPICSFCGTNPYDCKTSIFDYNNHNFSLIQTSEEQKKVNLFDFNTLKLSSSFNIEETQFKYGIQWLKPYTTLFYVAQQNISFYDTRTGSKVFEIPNANNAFVGGNVSFSFPTTFVMGNNNCLTNKNKQGIVSIYTLGNSKPTSKIFTKELKEFEVHKHLPFATAITDYLFTFNFDSGDILQQQQNIGYIPNSISLHHSESLVATRFGNKVQYDEIYY